MKLPYLSLFVMELARSEHSVGLLKAQELGDLLKFR
ncbi:hypothetical protein ES703_119138 [subsurface metagenome]